MKDHKKLFIVRHGKSSWDYDVEDIDRVLKERGINDAHTMSERLLKAKENPQLIISSHANRALHTALIFARTLSYPFDKIMINNIIYDGGYDDILEMIKELDDDIPSAMVFGHNPMSTDLANVFLKEKLDKLPTVGIASIDFKTDRWKKISHENVVTEFVDYPKKK
jgi:phosphohistidine phosphatase